MKYTKTTPAVFQLTSTAGRVALLCGLTAGTVTRKEVEAAIIADTAPRPYRKPVVACGMRFDSVTDGAVHLCGRGASHNKIAAMKKNIANWCNADNLEGYYWAE